MLKKRVIPCLLLHKGGLYKTVKFKNPNYIGDPINAIRIFNDKEVDELMFIDIDATTQNLEPNYSLIKDIASECFMPLSYGGGIKTVEQMRKINTLGVEKFSISSSAVSNLKLIREAADIFGSSSVIVTIDVKKDFFGNKKVYTHNGQTNTKLDVVAFAKLVESYGAGEIVINSIDRDGMMSGFDIELMKTIKESVNVPIIALGGAGNLSHIKEVINETDIDAVACGSMFVYQGPLKGVLISYPPFQKIKDLLESN